jgi:FAD binding domain/Berberine and berberine like
VATAVGFARDHGVALGVRGGGHNVAGTAIAEGGLLLDLSGMREVAVDPEARLARAGPGCRLADVDRATQAHGLATPLGFVSEVGMAGLTLGGGLGYLTRRALAPVRALGDPVFDLVGPMPYTQVQSPSPRAATTTGGPSSWPGWRTGSWTCCGSCSPAAPSPRPTSACSTWGGALNERPADDGAVGNRDARFVVGVKGMWSPGEPEEDRFRRWVRDAGERLRPFSTGANYDRLVEAKRRWDPDNLFRANRNIVP